MEVPIYIRIYVHWLSKQRTPCLSHNLSSRIDSQAAPNCSCGRVCSFNQKLNKQKFKVIDWISLGPTKFIWRCDSAPDRHSKGVVILVKTSSTDLIPPNIRFGCWNILSKPAGNCTTPVWRSARQPEKVNSAQSANMLSWRRSKQTDRRIRLPVNCLAIFHRSQRLILNPLASNPILILFSFSMTLNLAQAH